MRFPFRRNPSGVLVLVVAVAFLAGWYVGLPPRQSDDGDHDHATVTVWTCSMHPQIRQPNPGLCPICSMELIPLVSGGQAGGAGALRALSVSADAAALMDLRVSPVLRAPANAHVELFGKIAYDERNVNTTAARIGGRLDRFYIDYTGTGVRKGDHIAEIYSPDLFVAQQDLIQAARGVEQAREAGTEAALQTQQRLLNSARERLRLLQLTDQQINAIERKSEPDDHVTLFAPQDGIVIRRHVTEGAYIKTGDPLFAVAGLDTVWLNLEAYENDLPWLHFAQDVAFTVNALPGEIFHGRIAYIDQELDAMRRVVRVRVNVNNSDRLLKPGMFARATVDAKVAADGKVIDPGLAGKWISPMHPEIMSDSPGQCSICGMDLVPAEQLGFVGSAGAASAQANPLLVPASALLKTGERAVVYVRTGAFPEAQFEGREIVLGPRAGVHYIVRSGLAEGDMVVTRGAFKLDSELQIRARPSMMNRDAGMVELPASAADSSLLGQWAPVPRALGRLERASGRSDAEAVGRALDGIAAALDQVRTDALSPETLVTWNELSRRLRNALSVARTDSVKQPAVAAAGVRVAVEQAGRFLGLPFQAVPPDESADPGRTRLLRAALAAYFPLSRALAEDEEVGALGAREQLVPALRELGIGVSELEVAQDIAGLRGGFKDASAALVAAIRESGLDQVGAAYVIHCPMAFDHGGADWLSPEPVVVNPYFGAEMLHCGTVRETLSVESTTPTPAPSQP